jgi:hypothetical protein
VSDLNVGTGDPESPALVARSKKIGVEIRVEGEYVVIERTSWTAKLEHGLKGEKKILLSSITAIEYRAPREAKPNSAVWNRGFIHLSIKGSLERIRGGKAARFNENSAGFVWQERSDFERVREYLDRQIAKRSASNGGPAAVMSDVSDQIRKFAALRDDGIISDEEFEVKKRTLLN